MTVYGEVLFLENFITGAVILLLTGKIRSTPILKWRIITGAVMCGAYAFVLFAPMNWLLALLSKFVFSMAVTAVSYKLANLKSVLKTAGVFYIVSFLMGGVTIAVMYFMRASGLSANGSVYLGDVTYIHIIVGVILTWIAGVWLAEHLKEKMQKEIVIREVEICIEEKSWKASALIDTGNSLKEPVSGYPVAVAARELGMRIMTELGTGTAARTCIIPYKSVGSRGLLYGIRPDAIKIEGETITKIILGISQDDFRPWKGSENYEVLLHQQLLRGRK